MAAPSGGRPPVCTGWVPSQGPSFQDIIVSATQTAALLTLTSPRLESRWPLPPRPRSGPAGHQALWQTRLQLHRLPAVGVAFPLLRLCVHFQPGLRMEGSPTQTSKCCLLGSVRCPDMYHLLLAANNGAPAALRATCSFPTSSSEGRGGCIGAGLVGAEARGPGSGRTGRPTPACSKACALHYHPHALVTIVTEGHRPVSAAHVSPCVVPGWALCLSCYNV